MQRRNFIKTLSYLTCTTILTSGCNNFIPPNSTTQKSNQFQDLPKDFIKNLENDKFYYKSKKDLPKSIRLEACSLCQLNCPACTVRKLEKNAPKNWLGYLKFKDFKNFVDDNDFESIELSNNGEIFLNPELDKIIKYAHKKRIKLTASNGVNLNTVSEKTLENLVKYKFKAITVSIDGATPETYKIYRRGGDFNTVINNIKTINKFKKQYNSEFPKLTWQFILFGHNEHEIELARKKAGELGMIIKFRKASYDETYSPVKNPKLVSKLSGIDLLNADKQYLACKKIFQAPQIDYNGNLLGCCFIRLNAFKANAFKQDFLSALNSPDYIYAKHMMSDFSIPPKTGIPCTTCINYKFMKENNYPIS